MNEEILFNLRTQTRRRNEGKNIIYMEFKGKTSRVCTFILEMGLWHIGHPTLWEGYDLHCGGFSQHGAASAQLGIGLRLELENSQILCGFYLDTGRVAVPFNHFLTNFRLKPRWCVKLTNLTFLIPKLAHSQVIYPFQKGISVQNNPRGVLLEKYFFQIGHLACSFQRVIFLE